MVLGHTANCASSAFFPRYITTFTLGPKKYEVLYILLALIEGILGEKDKQIHMIQMLSMTKKTYGI